MNRQGFAIVTALTIMGLLAAILVAYSIVTVSNVKANSVGSASASSLHAAEAAMNKRAEIIREKFIKFATPVGVSPVAKAGKPPCRGEDIEVRGTGDMVCENVKVSGRNVDNYVLKGAQKDITIPAGENFAGLIAQETPFTVKSTALSSKGNPEAIATMSFKSRVVPLFQFSIFFDKDLEFDNTAPMILRGPVHSNGNIFIDGALLVKSPVTSAKTIYHGLKQKDGCTKNYQITDPDTNSTVDVSAIENPNGTKVFLKCLDKRREISDYEKTQAGGNLKEDLGNLEVPSAEDLEPDSDKTYWQKADVRIVLNQKGSNWNDLSSWEVDFVDKNWNSVLKPIKGSTTSACSWNIGGAANAPIGNNVMFNVHRNFRDNREAQIWESNGFGPNWAKSNQTTDKKTMLDVNVGKLLECMGSKMTSVPLSDDTDGGLVVYMTVKDKIGTYEAGARSNGPNKYGIRLHNASVLQSPNATHKKVQGLTFASNQAVYIQGNFNSDDNKWIPSSVVSDAVNVLSEGWNSTTTCSPGGSFYNNFNYYRGYATTTPQTYGVSRNTSANNIMGQQWYWTNDLSRADKFRGDAKSTAPLFCRQPAETTIKAAILSGSSTTGGKDGEGEIYTGQLVTSGGVHNIMRFHEDWYGLRSNWNRVTYNYTGSIVSFDQPKRTNGNFVLAERRSAIWYNGNYIWSYIYATYSPPKRNWAFEERFKQSGNLPPLTPKFVYLKQDNFTRRFVQDD